MFPFILLLLSVAFVAVYLKRKGRNAPPLPPGPPPDFLMGNLRLVLQHARELERPVRAETFHKWAQTYGDVMYLDVLGRKLLILDSLQAINDLLDKRSAIYSDRPEMAVFNLFGWQDLLGFLSPGRAANVQKGMIQHFFGRKDCMAFEHVQMQSAAEMVSRLWLSHTEEEKSDACQWYMISVMSQVLYGSKASVESVNRFEDLMKLLIKCDTAFGDFFPNYVHLLEWLPQYRESVQKGKSITRQMINEKFEETVLGKDDNERMARSFVGANIEKAMNDPYNVEQLKKAAAMCMAASSDPVHGTLLAFVLAMVLHPQCFAKAQEEIDAIVGLDRLPSLQDREQLPYLECVMQETMRWMPVVPTGVPHMSTEDDIYRGMFIPKGTLLVPNVRGLTLDENIYKDPTSFYPERFLPRHRGGREEPFNSTHVFGFGRRKCPGRYLADNGVWLALSSIIATCNLTMATTSGKQHIVPKVDFTDNLTALILKPFPFEISPRSAKSMALVKQANSVA